MSLNPKVPQITVHWSQFIQCPQDQSFLKNLEKDNNNGIIKLRVINVPPEFSFGLIFITTILLRLFGTNHIELEFYDSEGQKLAFNCANSVTSLGNSQRTKETNTNDITTTFEGHGKNLNLNGKTACESVILVYPPSISFKDFIAQNPQKDLTTIDQRIDSSPCEIKDIKNQTALHKQSIQSLTVCNSQIPFEPQKQKIKEESHALFQTSELLQKQSLHKTQEKLSPSNQSLLKNCEHFSNSKLSFPQKDQWMTFGFKLHAPRDKREEAQRYLSDNVIPSIEQMFKTIIPQKSDNFEWTGNLIQGYDFATTEQRRQLSFESSENDKKEDMIDQLKSSYNFLFSGRKDLFSGIFSSSKIQERKCLSQNDYKKNNSSKSKQIKRKGSMILERLSGQEVLQQKEPTPNNSDMGIIEEQEEQWYKDRATNMLLHLPQETKQDSHSKVKNNAQEVRRLQLKQLKQKLMRTKSRAFKLNSKLSIEKL